MLNERSPHRYVRPRALPGRRGARALSAQRHRLAAGPVQLPQPAVALRRRRAGLSSQSILIIGVTLLDSSRRCARIAVCSARCPSSRASRRWRSSQGSASSRWTRSSCVGRAERRGETAAREDGDLRLRGRCGARDRLSAYARVVARDASGDGEEERRQEAGGAGDRLLRRGEGGRLTDGSCPAALRRSPGTFRSRLAGRIADSRA